MATTDAKTHTPFEKAFEQVEDLNEQFVKAARKASHLALDSYEKAVGRAVDLELELAGLTRQAWLKSVIEAQAELTREVTEAYTTTARTLLK